MDKIPPFSADLITLLDQEFPHRCADIGENMETIQRYAGKRELVDLLLCLQTEANENILNVQ
jgi:hypothetical protein